MAHRRLHTLAAAVGLAALVAGSAHAQSGEDRRLDRIERDLKTLQSIVLQAQATGQPVVVRPEGADPALAALTSRVDDLEMTLQRINGQVETLNHDIDEAHRADQASDTQRQAQDKVLNDRLTKLETQVAALAQATNAGAAAPGDLGAAPTPAPALDAGAAATARAQAGDAGVLGGRAAPAPPPPPPPPTAAESFEAAHQLLTGGQASAAADAFQDFISRYPTNTRTPEAYYFLGESFYAQRSYQNATAAFASALRDRPGTAWAPAAMVRLAQSLDQSNQSPQACAALAEFDQRYAKRASSALKANAAAVRRRARCG